VSKVFLFSLTAALNPTLLAATTVMLLLARPKRLLLGYLLGAYTTGIAVGLAIEHWLSGSGAVSTTKRSLSPAIDITLGVLALLVAWAIRSGRVTTARDRRASKRAGKPTKTPRWQRLLSKGSARDTFIAGLVLSFPGASYLAALTEIDKQHLTPVAVVLTVVAVNLIMLAILELPLISYTIAPAWTPVAVERLKSWLAAHGGRAAVILATLIGLALVIRGVLELSL
jgi:Sap-like sulfolipid-1-addressing protein